MSNRPPKSQRTAQPIGAVNERLLLDMMEVMSLTGLGRATIYEAARDGTFPKPKKVGARLAKWDRRAVLQWIDHLPDATYALTPRGQLPRLASAQREAA
jgi:prophage regulatory protein